MDSVRHARERVNPGSSARRPPRRTAAAAMAAGAAMAIAAAPGAISGARAQAPSFPAKPLRILVGFTAGGAVDISARLMAQKLSEPLGQQVIVENRTGGGSMVAAEAVARSAPDGYTLLVANVTIAMPSMFARLAFDVRKDLAPVSLVGYGPVALIVHPSLPARSVKELVALARRKPGALNFGSAGTGSFTHLAMALFATMTGIDMVHVPYKGSTQANVGVMTGEAQLVFASPASAVAQIREGRLRALGVSGTKRSPLLPDVPPVAEAGVPGYDASSWYGMLAPAATPRPVISRLGDESARALATPDLKERLVGQGLDPARGGPEELAALIKAELPKWEKVIQAAKVPPQ